MPTTAPGNVLQGESAASLDQVNIWMRSSPWYQQLMKSWGQDPAHPGNLSDAQRTAIVRGAQAQGVKVDETHMEVDPNGNFRSIGHGLRNTLIVAGIAAATIATMGAAGVFGGPAAASEVGADAASTAGAGGAAAAAGGAGAATAAGAGAAGAGGAGVTGGGLLSALKTAQSIAGDVGQTAASIEKGRAAGQVSQAGIQQRQDQLALERAQLALSAPGQEAKNSVRGDVLANSQDASYSGLPSYIHIPKQTGGLMPSLLSANSRQLGANMSRTALANEMSGSDVPNLTPLPASTGLDTGLSALAGGAGFLNALKGLPGSGSGSSSSSGSGDPNGPGFVQGVDYGGNIPTDGDMSLDASGNTTSGIDPSILAWFAKQSVPGGAS